jgi:hypothetical protein
MHPMDSAAAASGWTPTPLSAPLPVAPAHVGIYVLWAPCDVQHRVYVGQAANTNARVADHRKQLRSGQHPTVQLQRAYTKYGESAFVWAFVEEVPKDRKALAAAEQWWTDVAGRERLFDTAVGSIFGKRTAEFCNTQLDRLTAQMATPESRAAQSAQSAHVLDRRSTPEARAASSARMKAYWDAPEARAAASARMAAPEARAAASASTKARMAARTPEQVAAFAAKCRATRARKKLEKA